MRTETAALEAVKAAPPVGYIAGVVAGFNWGQAASMLACAYTAWLLGEKIYRAVKAWRARRA
jgi:hypothetical protein